MDATAHTPRQDRTAGAILDAAARVLAAEGPGASMADVAATAGVGRTTLYRYFPTREALVAALAAEAVAEAGARLAAAGLDHVAPAEAIERIVRALLSTGERYAVLLRQPIAPRDPDIDRLVAEPIRSVFARAAREGAIRSDLRPEILVDLFGSLVYAAMQIVVEARLGMEDAASMTTTLFLHGASPPAGSTTPAPAP
jgi:TetR/AcrR family transcriptional repressor of lfrA